MKAKHSAEKMLKVFIEGEWQAQPGAAQFDREKLVSRIHNVLTQLNDGFDFGKELAEEWTKYLLKLLQGGKNELADPYSDIRNYHVRTFSDSTPNLDKIDSLYILDSLPDMDLTRLAENNPELHKTLLVVALGGTDSTFYKGFSREENINFAKAFYAPDVVDAFDSYGVIDMIPRGFAAKKGKGGRYVTNAESILLHAYKAGVRNVAVIANAKTYRPIEEYLKGRLHRLADLNIIVTAQPLLPRMRFFPQTGELNINVQYGGYPGGHGHGFKYCLRDSEVQRLMQKKGLEYFIFTNGDNSVVFNWGGAHFAKIIRELQRLKTNPAYDNLRISFLLVWEYLRKGGFSFLLQDKQSGETIPQIFEAELARKSGADIDHLKEAKGGYNTNVAVGVIRDLYRHLDRLPMALKEKEFDNCTDYTFEASLATAMTTSQKPDGSSVFDKKSAINILGPKTATYQHWSHIALRKRDDLLAFFSSLFKIGKIKTGHGAFPVIYTDRDATRNHPQLSGNIVENGTLNTNEFFEIFMDADFRVEDFYGTLNINVGEAVDVPTGKIKFRGRTIIKGDQNAVLAAEVPAGELWIVENKKFNVEKTRAITREDIVVRQWDKTKKAYF